MAAGVKHLPLVAALPCCVCGRWPVQLHHPRGAGLTGLAAKCSDWFTIPLCPPCHDEFHRDGRMTWEMRHGRQVDHVAATLERLYG